MTSPASSPDLITKKESISFAPPPPELNVPRLSQDLTSTEDLPRNHPQSEHRRSSSADGSGSSRKGRGMSSPPPPPAYTPRGTSAIPNVTMIMELIHAVGFDTFDTLDASTISLTLRSKHRFSSSFNQC